MNLLVSNQNLLYLLHRVKSVTTNFIKMAEYSCFISYRRNQGDKKFIVNLKEIIECEAQKATNIRQVFFDESSIKWGNPFNEKIYDGIITSGFFIPIYHNTYLHKDDLWCAKELYRAIKVQEKICQAIAGYCFILPLIDRGGTNALPECINNKNVKILQQLRVNIENKKTTKALDNFKEEIYNLFVENWNLLESKSLIIKDLCGDITIPSDDEIREWVCEQRKSNKAAEAKLLPVLIKTTT